MKELDLTQGSVPKVLLHFAVPFLLANVLQALYGGADLFVVGRYDDAASVAAVAIGSQVMQAVTGVILGLTTGITVLIGIATGAKDDRKTASIVGTGISALCRGGCRTDRPYGGTVRADSRLDAHARRGHARHGSLSLDLFDGHSFYYRL